MNAGYIIQTRFEVLYRDHASSPTSPCCSDHPLYGLPIRGREAPRADQPWYRGTNRDPVSALSYERSQWFEENNYPLRATPATNLLAEIEDRTDRDDGYVTLREDVLRIWEALGDEQRTYEAIYAHTGDTSGIPDDVIFLGYDYGYDGSDHFSCICDCMFFPFWHGTDKEGTAFLDHYQRLNRHGLFDTVKDAQAFFDHYQSIEWTEHSGTFALIHVYEAPT